MAHIEFTEKIRSFLQKYRYAFLIVLLGIALMLLPTTAPKQQAPAEQMNQEPAQLDFQSELREILSQIQGAGKVSVLLSVSRGESVVYQTDTDTTTGENGMTRVDTVIITGADRGQSGLIQHKESPVYLGAVVVCQGADSPAVRLAIKEAVSSITGLGTDKISVQKMK